MIATKRNTASIYDGCLNYLKESLSSRFAGNQSWTEGSIKSLVGNPQPVNAVNTPYTASPVYIEIFFGNNYILPSAYSLMGRRISKYDNSYLKSWNFYGRNKNGHWVLLHSQVNKPFYFAEERTFQIQAKESYNGFKIEMTDKDTYGYWGLCLGQVEVFLDIYQSVFNTKQCSCSKSSFHYFIILCLIS